MKKIVSVLIASALTLGSVFADVSLSFTQKGYISNQQSSSATKKFDLAGYDTGSKVTDCVVFTLSNDVCGVVFDVDPYYKHAAKSYGFDVDQYYGWINFFDGALKVQSGIWSNRNVNRMKTDAGQWENAEYEAFKPGVMNGKIAKDISSLTYIASSDSTPQSTSITYTAEKFFATGAIVTSDYGKFDSKSGFAIEGGFKLDDKTSFNAIVKSPLSEQYAFGVFADTKAITEKLDLMGGFTFGTASKDSAIGEKYTEWAADIRARYELNNIFALTTMNNISSSKLDSADDPTYSVWDMLSLAAKFKETVKFTLTGEWNYADLSVNNAGKLGVVPGIEIAPAANCSISTGVILNFSRFGTSSGSITCDSVAIPFILHVSL